MNKKLLSAFRRSKLSNYQLAKLSGVSESTIGRWVRGELINGLHLATALKLAGALKLKIELEVTE